MYVLKCHTTFSKVSVRLAENDEYLNAAKGKKDKGTMWQ
jgi:hypothetical protein